MNRPHTRARIGPAVAALAVGLSLPGIVLAGDAPPERLERLIPDDVIAYARLVELPKKLDALLEPEFERRLVSSSILEDLLELQEIRSARIRARELEEISGLDFVTELRRIFGREVALGFFLDFTGPQGLLLARLNGPEDARTTVARLRQAAEDATGKPFRGTISKYEGETIETFDSVSLLVVEDVVAVANQAGILESVVDLAHGRSRRSVLHSDTYSPVFRERSRLFQLALRPNFLPAVRLPEKLEPAASLLFGGWLGAVRASRLFAVDLDVDEKELVLRCSSWVGPPAVGPTCRPWFPPNSSRSLAERIEQNGLVAVVELHRNLAAWWENRSDFVVERATGKLAAFAQYVSIVLGGGDLEREILAEVGSPVAVVARRQRYTGGTPEPAIPGLALIIPVRNPVRFRETLLAAVQRLVGLVRVQQLRSGGNLQVSLSRVEAEGAVIHRLDLERRGETGPSLIDNFSPCLAFVEGHAVLSSTTSLAQSLIRDLGASPAEPHSASSSRADLLALDCAELLQVLRDNGVESADADDSLRGALDLLALFRRVRVKADREGDRVQVVLALER